MARRYYFVSTQLFSGFSLVLLKVAHIHLSVPTILLSVYMPVLPVALWEFLYAPVPFIAGIHSSTLDEMESK